MFTKPSRPIDTVWIHCSAASRKDINAAEIDQWHKDRGWSGIGYHYFIKSDGTLEAGRSLEKAGAHVRGHNKRSIGICLNGLHVSDFTKAQFDTLRKLCSEIDDAYGGIRFRGHNEVAAKACPVFDYREVLNLDKKGFMKDEMEPVPVPKAKPKPSPVDLPTLSKKEIVGVGTALTGSGGLFAYLQGAHLAVQLAVVLPLSLLVTGTIGYVIWKFIRKRNS